MRLDDPYLTIYEIGRKCNVSQQRVSQILVKNQLPTRHVHISLLFKKCRYCGTVNYKKTYCSHDCRTKYLSSEVHLLDRFMSKVNMTTKCWEWITGKTEAGYGVFRYYGNIYAHTAAYKLFVGPIPEGLYVCHHCDNPGCVNPEHLFIGTQSDNIRDSVKKGRWNSIYSHKPKTRPVQVCAANDANCPNRTKTNRCNKSRVCQWQKLEVL